MALQPRLYLDIDWADLISVFAPLGPSHAELTAHVEAKWPAHSVAALSVRTALDATLRSLALPAGSVVAMSAVTIQNMADVVRANEFDVTPVDLDLSTLAPSATQVDQSLAATGAKAYIHAHLYGSRTHVDEIVEVCRARGAVLIEDCAQGYLGAPPISVSAADVALYSFGPIKARTCLGGAAAVFRERDRAREVEAILGGHSPMPEHWLRIRALKYAALKILSSPNAYAFAVAALKAGGVDPESAIGGAARGFSGADLMVALRRAPSRVLLRLLARRSSQSMTERWRTHAGAILDDALAPTFERPGRVAPVQAFWLYPVLVEDPAGAVASMRAAGFDATRGATSLRSLIDSRDLAVSNAELLMRHVLYLPIAPTMSEFTLRRMATVLRERVEPLRQRQERVAA